MTTIDDDRRLFGSNPAAYAFGRPGYPSELFDVLEERCRLGKDIATLEVGPGTGQATAELMARGARPLIAVEPHEALAAYLVELFGHRVEVVNRSFEDVELARAGVSLAVSASAWHWVDQNVGLNRVARFLEPGGWWACWWSLYHDPEHPDPLYEALDPVLGSLPSRSTPANHVSTDAFVLDREARTADLAATGAFAGVEVDRFGWDLELDPQRARLMFGTFSRILALPDAEREDVLDWIAEVVESQFDGRAIRRCVTILYTAQRI